MGQQKRERKLTGSNTLPAVHRTKGRSKSRGASRLQICPAPPEAGSRGEGKGAGSAPRTAFPTTLQTGLQFLTKDFLRFWTVDIHWEGRGYTQGTGGDWGWGHGGERAHCTRGEGAPQAPGCLSCLGRGRHKTQAQPSPRFVEPRAAQGTLHIEQTGA